MAEQRIQKVLADQGICSRREAERLIAAGMFDPAGGGKLPYAAGDRIRFVPISPEKFETIQKEQGAAL